MSRREIIFEVTKDQEGGFEAGAVGESIYTEGETFEELCENVRGAVTCHFLDDSLAPSVIILELDDRKIEIGTDRKLHPAEATELEQLGMHVAMRTELSSKAGYEAPRRDQSIASASTYVTSSREAERISRSAETGHQQAEFRETGWHIVEILKSWWNHWNRLRS